MSAESAAREATVHILVRSSENIGAIVGAAKGSEAHAWCGYTSSGRGEKLGEATCDGAWYCRDGPATL